MIEREAAAVASPHLLAFGQDEAVALFAVGMKLRIDEFVVKPELVPGDGTYDRDVVDVFQFRMTRIEVRDRIESQRLDVFKLLAGIVTKGSH